MTARDPTQAEIWASRRDECRGLEWLVNRELRDMGRRDLQDTEVGRRLVAFGVLYGVGPVDVACQIVDDIAEGKAA